MRPGGFRDLEVWQESMILVEGKLAHRPGMCGTDVFDRINSRVVRIGRMLHGLHATIR
jgi:hypothetical protein